jgi:hypothetical protein
MVVNAFYTGFQDFYDAADLFTGNKPYSTASRRLFTSILIFKILPMALRNIHLETCNSLRKNLHGYFRKLGVFVPFLN